VHEIMARLGGVLAQDGGSGNMWTIAIGLALALLAMWIIGSRGQKKERQAREEMLNGLARNDRIVTRGGMIGVISDVKDDEIVVKVDEATNAKIRMKKWAVAGLLNKDKDKDQPGEQEK